MMQYILDRLAENSTWRGIILLVTAAGIKLSPDQAESIIAVGLTLVAAINIFRKAPVAPVVQPVEPNIKPEMERTMAGKALGLMLLIGLVAAMGCATPQTTAYKTLAVTATTVQQAKAAYGEHLRTEIAALDLMTADQRAARIEQLRTQRDNAALAYARYQAAMGVAEAAVESARKAPAGDWTAAMDAATAAATAFLEAVKPFIK